MQKVILVFVFILLHQSYCSAEAIVNTRAIGFSEEGDFFAIYQYKHYSESYTWYGRLSIIDIKASKEVGKVEMEKEYNDSIPNEFLINDLLENLLMKDSKILDGYGIIEGNAGFLSYYKSPHAYFLNNNECNSNHNSPLHFQIPVCSERFVTQSLGGATEYSINLTTFIVDQESLEEEKPGCPDCTKLFKLKIVNEGNTKLAYDFKDELNHDNCYRDYAVGSIYFYGSQKIVILMYGMKPGFEGFDIEPIIITGIIDSD